MDLSLGLVYRVMRMFVFVYQEDQACAICLVLACSTSVTDQQVKSARGANMECFCLFVCLVLSYSF